MLDLMTTKAARDISVGDGVIDDDGVLHKVSNTMELSTGRIAVGVKIGDDDLIAILPPNRQIPIG